MSVSLLHGDCIEVMAELGDASIDAIVSDPPYGLEFMGKDWDRPWQTRGDNPASAGMSEGGFAKGNGYANRVTPSYGRAWANKRCTKCGHIASGGSPCTCPDPEWVMERGDIAAPMRAFGEWCEQWGKQAYRILKPGGYICAFSGSRTFHRLTVGLEDAGFAIEGCAMWLYGSGFPKSLDVAKDLDKREGIWRGRAGEQISENGSMAAGNYERSDKGNAVTDAAQRWEGWGTALKPAWEPIVIGRKS